jgi:hypothetical protein
MDGKFLLKTALIFCTSSLSLWGTGPNGNEAEGEAYLDDEPLLRSQLSLLEDTVEVTINTAREYLEGSESMARTSATRLSEDIYSENGWMFYLRNLDEAQAACLRYAAQLVALKNIALATQDAAFHGLHGTRLPNGEMTDPIMEAWDNFGNLLQRQDID